MPDGLRCDLSLLFLLAGDATGVRPALFTFGEDMQVGRAGLPEFVHEAMVGRRDVGQPGAGNERHGIEDQGPEAGHASATSTAWWR